MFLNLTKKKDLLDLWVRVTKTCFATMQIV
jgi:hypothetical protein